MKKRLLSLALAFVLAFSLLPTTAWAAEVKEISTPDQFARMDADGNYILTKNITVSTPYAKDFSGTFDGNGHTITLDISGTANTGLFSKIGQGGTVKNVITAGTVTGTGTGKYVGGIAGTCEGTIQNCGNTAVVTGKQRVGGIAGHLGSKSAATIENCYNAGAITGTSYAGGIAGYVQNGASRVENTLSCGNVSAKTQLGALVGYCQGGLSNSWWKSGMTPDQATGWIAEGKASSNASYTDLQTAVNVLNTNRGSNAKWAEWAEWADKEGVPVPKLVQKSDVSTPEISLKQTDVTLYAEENLGTRYPQQATLTAQKSNLPDDAKIVWKINNEQAAVIIPVEGTDESILVKAAVGGAATVTATVCDAENNPIKVKEESGEKIVRATCKVTVIPHITTVEIKNVKQPGAVAVGQTVQAQVNILGGDEYDYENYPKLTYQWYQGTTPIQEATNRTYTISDDFKEWDKIGVNVACNGETVHSYNDHQQYVRSADYGKLYPVAYDENFTLPSEIKEDTKLELPTEHTKGGIKAGIAWSGFSGVIAEDGTVTRPAAGKTEVKLTARFTYGAAYANRTFKITVWSQAEVEAEANDKVLQLNNAIDAAKLNTLSPTYGKDTNMLTMVETKLNNPDISVSIKGVEKTNATDNSSNIADNGDVTFFYANPNNAPLQRFGTYSVTFTFTRDGITAERTIPVVVYWDQTQVKSVMTAEILDKVTVDEEATVTANFDLPKVVDGKKWTLISWQSSDPAITISTKKQTTADTLFDPYVAVVRGGSAEKKVTLTANFTFQLANSSDETSALTLHKTFTVNVAPSADGEKYQEALDAVFTADKLTDAATGAELDLGAVKNDIQFPTTRDLGAYMKEHYREGFDGKYTPVVITSRDTAVIAEPDVANAARVAVYRPAVGKEAKTVTLTVKILDRPSGEGRNYANLPVLAEKRFTVTVKPLTREEVDAELALMAEVKAHYWDGIKNDNDAAGDVTGDLAPFVEVYKENGALVWVRDVREMRNSGIVPVAMNGWQELEAWRLFRSSNPAAVTHENLLVTQQFEGKAVTVTSALSSETLGRYGELYRNDPETYAAYAELADLYYQPVSAELVVRGRNTANMVKKMIPVNGGTEMRLVSKAVEEKVTVSFTLSGNGELWLGTRMIRDLDEGVTVFDVLEQLRDEGVLRFEHKGGYVQSITCGGKTLAELDEGKNSGWLYTVNGELPDVYMSAYGLKNGDSVRVYFTKDYTKEPGADRWKPVTPVTKTETVTNADGSTTKTETKPDGTVIETTTWRDGSTLTAETSPNGRVETVEKRADGTTVETVESASGGITASVSVPKSVGSTRVDIPVSKPTGSMVAVIVHPDGTEEIVRGSVVTETGIALRAEGDVRLKIIDNAKSFNDMADHWAKDAVEFASSRELFNGVGNDAFGPDRSMTRGMVSTVLARLAGADTAGGETWYAKGTVWAVENGISDGTAPEQPVTREQLAAMLYRYAGSPAVSGELSFDDTTVISIWAYDAVRWCVDNGILNGVGGNRMAPQDLAQRGQVAAMLMRFLQATV